MDDRGSRCTSRPNPNGHTRRDAGSVRAVPMTVAKLNTASSRYRQRKSEQQRLYNRSIRSATRTRVKHVIKFVDDLEDQFRSNDSAISEADFLAEADALVAKAFSEIDRAVTKGVLKKTTAARRKSRVTRLKREFRVRRGWEVPAMDN